MAKLYYASGIEHCCKRSGYKTSQTPHIDFLLSECYPFGTISHVKSSVRGAKRLDWRRLLVGLATATPLVGLNMLAHC